MVKKAALWILDEPFTALDAQAVELLARLIIEHVKGGGMAILTSHQSIPLPNGKILKVGA
jgi:heme exporter protein A